MSVLPPSSVRAPTIPPPPAAHRSVSSAPPGPPSTRPPRAGSASGAPPASRAPDSGPLRTADPSVVRGAKIIVARCLQAASGERVHILTYRADRLYDLFARAVESVGAVPVPVPVDALAHEALSPAQLAGRLTRLLAGATATILLAPERPPAQFSVVLAETTHKKRTRHLHLLQIDERLLGQSMRADPDLLEIVNKRLAEALEAPCHVRVSSDHGTDLDVRLALAHPILSSAGRPAPGASENLPAGLVYTHPARFSGTLAVDRGMFGPGVSLDRGALRRAPLVVRFAAGRVASFEAPEPAVARVMETYLASHADAGRVGILVFPTNYLARSEVGIDRQDMLLPGMTVSLGYADQGTTRAPYEAPVQLVLLGKRQTVEVGPRKLVDCGRLDEALVEGIDPFR